MITILYPEINALLPSRTFTVRGAANVGSVVYIRISAHDYDQKHYSVGVPSTGYWEIEVNTASVGNIQLAWSYVPNSWPAFNYRYFVRPLPPPTVDDKPSFEKISGRCLQDGEYSAGVLGVELVDNTSGNSLGEVLVNHNGVWELVNDLPAGTYQVKVRHRLEAVLHETLYSSWSRVFECVVGPPVSNPPVIEVPGPNDVTDMRGSISGRGAVANTIVEVLKDLEHLFKIGEGTAGANGQWIVTRFDRDMPPGPFSIVARQIVSGVPSDVSAARSFKVRPPALNGVNVTSPSETVLKFSGPGHTGATVEFTVVSGPGGTPPSAVTVTGGRWETTVTNWPFGLYSLEAIQKVSDNANGWIESLPYLFPVNRVLPDPSDIEYTNNYQPTFTGTGYNHATVKIADPGGSTFPAPNALVSAGKWSSRASQEWGPTLNRDVYFRQFLDGQQSPTWVNLIVTIPPLAPVIGQMQEDGLSPKISGTCWSGAVVEVTFSDAPLTKHPAIVTGTNWTFQRETPFAPDVPHIVTVTQFAAGQTSPAASKTFTVYTPMLKPLIFEPEPSSQVGRDVTVKGRSGMAGASMQLRDVVSGRDLGEPKLLIAGGDWSIDLTVLEFREYTADAQQTLNQRESERSDMLKFEVVLLPPVFTQPTESGDQPRTATLEGEGMPLGRVEVWLAGDTGPLLRNIPVDSDGHWKAEVTLPVGAKIIWARQTFDGQISKDSPPLNYNVVPAAPYIETPALDEHIGRRVVISGFGVPGDRVTVKLGGAVSTVLGRSPVLEDRTWSVTVMLNLPGGRYGLVAVASCDGFESADSPERSVVLGAFLPSIDVPAAGRWVSDPVRFEGQGKPGIGQLMSWFNSERIVSSDVPVSPTGWQCNATWPFPGGGNWCRFKQTLTDPEEGGTVSDWADSHRFQVWPASPTKA